MNNIIQQIHDELMHNSDEHTKQSGQNFFKEKIILHGVKSAVVSAISKKYYQRIKDKKKSEILDICEELWKSGYLEETFIACSFSYSLHKSYKHEDFAIFETWVKKYINNWASCDTFCNHTIGAFIEIYPEYINKLKRWATVQNRWVRRASVVSLIIPAKHGKFLKEVFEISDILLKDTDDMVQKGYGWLLKVTSQAHEKEVFDFVMKRKTIIPRTALRYAIEKMPVELKEKAMQK
jgi:3-methyladenine DNA glycosylase AlkD